MLRGQPEWVPVGTTVLDAIAQSLPAEFLGNAPPGAPANTLSDSSSRYISDQIQARLVKRMRLVRWKDAERFQVRPFAATRHELTRFLTIQLQAGDELEW